MNMKIKFKILSAFLAIILCLCPLVIFAEESNHAPAPENSPSMNLSCKSAVLMEASSGQVLYSQNADAPLPPASVTKVMTLLLIMEAIDAGKLSLDDTIVASAHAASMGGSQIFLKEGESMSAEDMIKSVVIASANDACVALAEHIAGSEEAFVSQMNKRAAELGMKNTTFENTNGLDDTAKKHLTSAMDIAIMSRELIGHEKILEYSSIWMDTIRNGAFGLTNTNRLVRFYKGATGLKTGSTSKAGFCVSATAKRDGMSLICVIMGADTRDIRNAEATKLLDWGFANYELYSDAGERLNGLSVLGGKKNTCDVSYGSFSAVLPKGSAASVKKNVLIPEKLSAPIEKGGVIGKVEYTLGSEKIGEVEIQSISEIEKIGYFDLVWRILKKFLII